MHDNPVKPVIQEDGYPYLPSSIFSTSSGTPYLRTPGVHLIARPSVSLASMGEFLGGYDSSLGFESYQNDPDTLPAGTELCKTAGQLCYMSFAPRRTMNADASRYFQNIKMSGHGSVLEHASFSFLIYGISRSVTHELVRHRAGFAFSQVSQRYCSGRIVRFVERTEYVQDPWLHARFEERIDRAAADYEDIANHLLIRQKAGSEILSAEMKTDLRKKVQQAARSLLPNETEAPIMVTANARAWRHFIEMRASSQAEVEIRALAFKIYQCLFSIEPILFEDYSEVSLPDGTWAVATASRKV